MAVNWLEILLGVTAFGIGPLAGSVSSSIGSSACILPEYESIRRPACTETRYVYSYK